MSLSAGTALSAGEDITVLHVDDDPDVLDITATFLQRADRRFEVVTETDPDAALDRLDGGVDCVVSDYQMPAMDGLAFLDAVRDEAPELPFVLFTGKGSEEIASDECDSPHLVDVADAHRRMETLIEDLLMLAREGETVAEFESVDLGKLLSGCWETLGREGAALAVETGTTVRADRDRLRQLLENLLTNALEHGGTDVTITVGDLADGFYVEDDGPGIPDDDREDVFVSGYSTDDWGTGFGLGIVDRIAEAHGWKVRATEGSNGGARFEVTGVKTVE